MLLANALVVGGLAFYLSLCFATVSLNYLSVKTNNILTWIVRCFGILISVWSFGTIFNIFDIV